MGNNTDPMNAAAAFPLVGQPLAIHRWFPTVSITCNCLAKQPLLLIGFGTVSQCPACGRAFRLLAASQDTRTGTPPHLHIDILLPSATKD